MMGDEKAEENALTWNVIWYSSSLLQNKRELAYNVGSSESISEVSFNPC